MKDNKVYVLLKEIPGAQVGDEFIWNESVNRYCRNGNVLDIFFIDAVIKSYSYWFKPKEEERIVVNFLEPVQQMTGISEIKDFYYDLKMSKPIPKDKIKEIKETIESIVNDGIVLDKDVDLYVWIKRLKQLCVKSKRFEIAASIRDIERWLSEIHIDPIESVVNDDKGKEYFKPYDTRKTIDHSEPSLLPNNKQEEKDWEILSYINPNIITDIPNGNIEKPNNYNIFKNYPIHSVLRKSDNEVFTIEDKTDHGVIESFYIECNQIWARMLNMSGIFSIKELTKSIKKILFTTEDGVNIYEGDSYWWVSTKEDEKYISINEKWDLGQKVAIEKYILPLTKNYKQFSTKEKAEEYIIQNKPCLSLNDLLSVWDKWSGGCLQADINDIKNTSMYKRFEQLVKDKISK